MLHEGAIFTFIILGKIKTFFIRTPCVSINQRRKGKRQKKSSMRWICNKKRRKRRTFHRLFIFIGYRRKAVMVIRICEIEREVFKGRLWNNGREESNNWRENYLSQSLRTVRVKTAWIVDNLWRLLLPHCHIPSVMMYFSINQQLFFKEGGELVKSLLSTFLNSNFLFN